MFQGEKMKKKYIKNCKFSPDFEIVKFCEFKKKCIFSSFFLFFFQFLTLKHKVKNVNLDNVILRLESEKSIFLQVFVKFLTKNKVFFFVLRAKVKKNKKLEKCAIFMNSA